MSDEEILKIATSWSTFPDPPHKHVSRVLALLKRVAVLEKENATLKAQREQLKVMISQWVECYEDGSPPDGDMIDETADPDLWSGLVVDAILNPPQEQPE